MDDGTVPDEVLAARAAEREERERQAEIRKEREARESRLRSLIAEMGTVYGEAKFANYDAPTPYQQTVLEAVKEYSDTFPDRRKRGDNLVLYGPVGTGKDHLAAAVCKQAILQHGMTVRFCKGQDWFGNLRDGISDEKSEFTLLAPLKDPDLVVISDPLPPFGNLTQHQATMLYRAVEHRAANGKPTLLTINVADESEADARMGVPVWDRLKQSALLIYMAWASHRQPTRHIRPASAK